MDASLAVRKQPEAAFHISDDEEHTSLNTTHEAPSPAPQEVGWCQRYPPKMIPVSIATSLSSQTARSSTEAAPITTSGPLNVLALDRAQMERERLARQAAKQAQALSPAASEHVHLPKIATTRTGEIIPASSNPSFTARTAKSEMLRPVNDVNRNTDGDKHIAGPSSTGSNSLNSDRGSMMTGRPTGHPLQSSEPFLSDAAGEYYLAGEMRHTQLDIGESTDARTFALPHVIGEVSPVRKLY